MANQANVAAIRAILDKFKPWFEKYYVGLPEGIMAAFVFHESGGKMVAGDPTLGEYGLLQTSAWAPPVFGYDPSVRYDAENGFAISSLLYAYEAALMYLRYSSWVDLGSKDNWMLAKLSTSIGRSGSYTLIDRALVAGYGSRGDLFGSVLRSTQAAGGLPLGSQSADKVAARVAAVPVTFEEGEVAEGIYGWASYSPPTKPQAPPAGPYTLPANVADLFVTPISPVVTLLLGGGAVLLYLLWRD